MNNKFSSKSSGNETAKKKINVIRNVSHSDTFGDSVEKTWFNIPITNTNISVCANATIQSSIITTPIIFKVPDMTIPLAFKLRKTPNIIFSISNVSASQIMLYYGGNCYTNVSIYRDGNAIAINTTGTSYIDSGLSANTSYTYIVLPNNLCNTGIPTTITQITLPNLTSLSVSSYTASQIVLAYTGNYTTVIIYRDSSEIATNITTSTYTNAGLTANTSYTYIVIPDNSTGGGTSMTITQKTLPNLTSLSVSSYTTSQIVLAYTGHYSTVSITRDGSAIVTDSSGTTYTDASSGLIANTSYTYIVIPYDVSGNAGTSMTITQKTLPKLTSLSVSSYTASQIVLSYTGNYANVNISRDGSAIVTNITGTTYTDASGLTANTSHTYIVIPHDVSGNAGTSMTITQKTLSNITSLSVSSYTTSQIVLAYTGNYDSVSITRDGSSLITDSSGTTYTDASSGLTANTYYTYIVIPYDVSGNVGTSMTITQLTLPNLTSLSVSSYTASQIVLAYTGNYATVSISRDASSLITNSSGTTYTDSSGLTANTSHTYIVIPYDVSGNAGTSMTITQKTLPNLTLLRISSYTASQIVLAYTGNYSTVSITRDSSAIITDSSGTTYTDVSGLTANTYYTYIVIPYDVSGNAGTSMTITQKSLPNLTSLSVSSYTTSQIVLAFSGNYATVSITRDGSAIVSNSSGTTYTDVSGLTANTSYTYIVIPYDIYGNSGTSMTITQITSLHYLTSLSVSSFTASQIVLAYTGNYTTVSITRDGTAIATNITGTTYTDASGLTGNTSYTYIVIPYDVSGDAGTSMTITQKTLSNVSLSISSYTDSQMVLESSGNYTNISISRNGTAIATNVTGTTYTDSSGLTANTSYTYIVTPYNSGGTAGTTSSITKYTLGDITSLSVSSVTATQIVLAFSGIYTNVSITRNGTVIAAIINNVTGTTYTDSSGLSANTSYIYIVTPNNASGNAGTSVTITQKTLPNLTILSVSSYTESQIILAFSGNYDTVSITRDAISLITGYLGTTYTDSSGLTGNTSHTYIVIPYDVSGNAGTSMTITQKTLPNLTSLSVSSYTASQIVLAFSGNYTTVSIFRDAISITTGFSGTTYTDSSGLTATTSYTYIIIPYDIYGNAGTSMTVTQNTI